MEEGLERLDFALIEAEGRSERSEREAAIAEAGRLEALRQLAEAETRVRELEEIKLGCEQRVAIAEREAREQGARRWRTDALRRREI